MQSNYFRFSLLAQPLNANDLADLPGVEALVMPRRTPTRDKRVKNGVQRVQWPKSTVCLKIAMQLTRSNAPKEEKYKDNWPCTYFLCKQTDSRHRFRHVPRFWFFVAPAGQEAPDEPLAICSGLAWIHVGTHEPKDPLAKTKKVS